MTGFRPGYSKAKIMRPPGALRQTGRLGVRARSRSAVNGETRERPFGFKPLKSSGPYDTVPAGRKRRRLSKDPRLQTTIVRFRLLFAIAATSVMACFPAANAGAQSASYPNRPVKLVIPFP